MKSVSSNRTATPFDKLFEDFFGTSIDNVLGRDMSPLNHRLPATNIIENDDAFTLEVSAPGFDKGDFSVNLEKDILSIEAKTEEKKDDESTGKFHLKEFRHRSLKRNFTLPEHIDGENISAKYEKGILFVTIPKVVEPKISKNIEIG